MITVEEKYQFLLEWIGITDVDTWEKDALIQMRAIYFQFPELPKSKDECVILAMKTHKSLDKECNC